MEKKVTKKCPVCEEKIDGKKDHYVEVSIYNRKSVKSGKKLADDHVYFHINCYKAYFQDRVNKKANELIGLSAVAASKLITPLTSSFSGVFAAPKQPHADDRKKRRKTRTSRLKKR